MLLLWGASNIMMQKHIRGQNIDHQEAQALITAALRLHGKQSLNKLMKLTGYHFQTVKNHVLHLIAEGTVERVQKEEYEYQLPKEEGGS
jgi:urease gamma subunit